jgi:hypothetical protein
VQAVARNGLGLFLPTSLPTFDNSRVYRNHIVALASKFSSVTGFHGSKFVTDWPGDVWNSQKQQLPTRIKEALNNTAGSGHRSLLALWAKDQSPHRVADLMAVFA